jgi:hypothetical protein
MKDEPKTERTISCFFCGYRTGEEALQTEEMLIRSYPMFLEGTKLPGFYDARVCVCAECFSFFELLEKKL